MTTRPMPGDLLAGKYRIERLIGEGGMGFVLCAVHVELDRRVAIKLLRAEFSHRSDSSERLRREARAAAKIRSEHVARVLDVGTIGNGETFIVMEHLDGNDLAEELRLRGRLPIAEAVGFVTDTARGVAEAHASGVVHRDLKPANVFLVTNADGSRTAKVLDFGISKSLFLSTGGSDLSLTNSSAVMGSPIYMSPEQMQSAKDVDHRTDVWALGAILYEALAGDPPHRGQSMADVCGAVLNDPPESLSRYRSDIPAGLEPLVLRCLSKDREERFPSVLELVNALEAIVPPRPRNSVRFSRGGSAPGVKSLPFLVIATGERGSQSVPVVSATPTEAPQSHTVAPPPQPGAEAKSSRTPLYLLLGAAAIATCAVLALLSSEDDPGRAAHGIPAAAPLPVLAAPPPLARAPAPNPPVAVVAEATAAPSAVPAVAPAEPEDTRSKPVPSKPRDRARAASHDGTAAPQNTVTTRQAFGAEGIPEFGGRR